MINEENKQDQLFLIPQDEGTIWKEQWKEMPEYIQEDLTPLRTLLVHFEKEEDVEQFSKLLNQPITGLTKSMWYPQLTIQRLVTKRYSDEP